MYTRGCWLLDWLLDYTAWCVAQDGVPKILNSVAK